VTLADRRLIAHLAPDEPRANAQIAGDLYLADAAGRHARALREEDWTTLPGGAEPCPDQPPPVPGELHDRRGRRYRLGVHDDPRHGPQLRWLRRGPRRSAPRPVALRTVIGALEDYEPARSLTAAALDDPSPDVGTQVLARERRLLETGSLVLNRALREAVHRHARSGEASLSQIAARCGHGKCAATGLRIGDTSWLGRRIGALPEAGASEPTPWIHTELLALIAREGLGVCPREVELA
jgi:hypothetical protein